MGGSPFIVTALACTRSVAWGTRTEPSKSRCAVTVPSGCCTPLMPLSRVRGNCVTRASTPSVVARSSSGVGGFAISPPTVKGVRRARYVCEPRPSTSRRASSVWSSRSDAARRWKASGSGSEKPGGGDW